MGRGDWKRSFRRNEGQRTRAQRRALRDLWPRFGLTWTWNETLDISAAFGFQGRTWLDVGFGTGESIVELAGRFPDDRFLGVEVYRPGIGATLMKLADHDLDNVRLVRGDVFELLSFHLEQVLDRVCVFFPEPWPDAPDRRLIRPRFLRLLERTLVEGGSLHLATDVAEYLDHAREVVSDRTGWTIDVHAQRPGWRPETEYERRAIEEGREVHDATLKMTEVNAGDVTAGD